MEKKEKYSKFEMVRIIAARSLQIAQGSPILVNVPKTEKQFDPMEIAAKEWELDVIPIDIQRKLNRIQK